MAKVAFSKLKCKTNDTEVAIQIGEETIMIKQYLPIQDKLNLISIILSMSHDEEVNYTNPILNNVLTELYVVFAYSNINFTDKQKEDLPKLYDMLKSSGILSTILNAIPTEEYNIICDGVKLTSNAIYQYRQSLLGILEIAKNQYDGVNFDLNQITDALSSEEMTLLKDIVTKLG